MNKTLYEQQTTIKLLIEILIECVVCALCIIWFENSKFICVRDFKT